MKINLENKIAIVTGSIQGIGREISTMLADAGASVVINNHRDEERLTEVANEIQSKTGANVKPVIADVTIENQAQKLIDAALELGQTIDVLVNNAGGLIKRVPIAEFEEDHFNTVINVNLKSAFVMAKLVAPVMKKQKSAKVINLSSQAAHDGGGGGAAAYAASKGGIWTFTKSLAKELASFGITVNCVSPGFIAQTAFHDTFTPKESQDEMPSKIPLGRVGEAADIAKVVLFMASELSDYMTGQTIEVNGGLYMP